LLTDDSRRPVAGAAEGFFTCEDSMRTTITSRHCEISEELRQRAQAVLNRLAALMIRPVDATLVFDVAPQQATAEIRLHGSGGELVVASGEDKDHRSALDRAEALFSSCRRTFSSARRGRGARDAV
jgi:ribosome-associated translation inhibitor RaiA